MNIQEDESWWSTTKNFLIGGVIFMFGDIVASIILNEFSWTRTFGILVVASTIYAWEVTKWFDFIERKTINMTKIWRIGLKTVLSSLFFNPIWVWRHFVLLNLLNGTIQNITWDLWQTAFMSFLVNIPVSMIANYIIQNKITIQYRFWASSVFSGIMAIYYALSSVWF